MANESDQSGAVTEPLYLMHLTGQWCGDFPVFYASRGGYSPDIDRAKRFTAAEADQLERGSRGSHAWRRWPVSVVLQAAIRVCNSEALPRKPAVPTVNMEFGT